MQLMLSFIITLLHSMYVPTNPDVESNYFESPQLCRQFTFTEIQLATNDLDESLVIGQGGFGKVYKGTITNGLNLSTVAIKRLDSISNQGASEFWAEVNMLSNLRHCHLVSLIGYCNDDQEMILVYKYMSRGALKDHLRRCQTPLSWVQRLTICIGAARGLDYLHTGTGIKHGVVHRDVKSSNILLDDSWAAKISDFGLSKICAKDQKDTYVRTGVKGTFGYLDPDYFYTGKLTVKSDVYAFGVILFEVLSGKQAVDRSIDEEQWSLVVWAQDSIKRGRLKQIVDANISGMISPKSLKVFVQLAKQCLHKHPKQRPTMAEVVVGLESVMVLQEKTNSTLQSTGMKFFTKNLKFFSRKTPKNKVPLNDVDRSIDEKKWGLSAWAQKFFKAGRLKQIVNTNIRGVISLKCLKVYAQLAKRCGHKRPQQQSNRTEVVVGFESVMILQEKSNNTLHSTGTKFFSRKVNIFARKTSKVVVPSNSDNSGFLQTKAYHSWYKVKLEHGQGIAVSKTSARFRSSLEISAMFVFLCLFFGTLLFEMVLVWIFEDS